MTNAKYLVLAAGLSMACSTSHREVLAPSASVDTTCEGGRATNAAELERFAHCTDIRGNLQVGGVSTLAPLAALRSVGEVGLRDRHDAPHPRASPALAERLSQVREHGGALLQVVDASSDGLQEHEEAPAASASRARRTGTVRSPGGHPVAGALVHAGDAVGLAAESTTVSDEHGRYEIAAGRGLLWATHADWCESQRLYVPSLSEDAPADLVLGATRGRVEVEVVSATGEPVAGAQILFDPASNTRQTTTPLGRLELQRPPAGATTDDSGRCSLLFPEGSETVLLVIAGDLPGWRRSIPTPADGGSLRIELPAPASLTGTCRDEAGQLLPGARLEVTQ